MCIICIVTYIISNVAYYIYICHHDINVILRCFFLFFVRVYRDGNRQRHVVYLYIYIYNNNTDYILLRRCLHFCLHILYSLIYSCITIHNYLIQYDRIIDTIIYNIWTVSSSLLHRRYVQVYYYYSRRADVRRIDRSKILTDT